MDRDRVRAALIVSNKVDFSDASGPGEIFIRRTGEYTSGSKGGYGMYGWAAARLWRVLRRDARWNVGVRRRRYDTETEEIHLTAPSKDEAVDFAADLAAKATGTSLPRPDRSRTAP